jgi:hypothetical protein
MKVSVQQEDIQQGVRGNAYHCPIARALQRETGMQAVVCTDRIALYEEDKADLDVRGETGEPFKEWNDVPSEARVFITMFDADCHIEPFEFEL